MARHAHRDDEEPPRPVAELPAEVLERLSLHGKVRLFIGDDLATGVEANVAPLDKQLFLLVARGGRAEQDLLDDPRAVIQAEDRSADWILRATGRAVPGRPVTAEPRRPELAHWIPDRVSPSGLVAVRFHPETVDYSHGKGAARVRAVGPVPHGAPPGAATRWALLATDGTIGWYALMALLDWIGLIWLFDEPERPALLLVLVLGIGLLLLGGVQLVHQAARFFRWREGLERDEDAAMLVAGWESPARLRLVGSGMIALGALLAVLLALGAGWPVAALAVLSSNAPLLAVFYTTRHFLRRKDADTETG